VDGARNVISALESQKSLHRVVLVFSTEVYAQKGGEWVDEKSPIKPESFSGNRLLDGERLVPRSFLRASFVSVASTAPAGPPQSSAFSEDHEKLERLGKLALHRVGGYGNMRRRWSRLGDQEWAKDERSPSRSPG
jgi:hypothetical protein